MTPSDAIGQQDLRTWLKVLWRWKFLFLAFVVAIPVAVYLYEHGKPKMYESNVLLEVQDGTGGSLPITSGNLLAVARIVTTTPIAERAARRLSPPPPDPDALVGEVSTSADTNTGLLTISAEDPNPQRAAAVATAFAHAIGAYQSDQSIHNINLQIAAAVKQLKQIPRSDVGSRQGVSQQIAQLRAQRGAAGVGAQIVQPAAPNHTPVGPRTQRAVELAFVISLLLGIGAVILAENSDRRLRSPEDLEQLTDWPLLGVIASSAFSAERPMNPRDQEAFHMLRADLTHFNTKRSVKSVALISPLVGDGKTTVAVGLATACAQAGRHVILVDADLRRPQVSARLGLDPGPGLGAVLGGDCGLTEAIIDYEVPESEGASIRVLPAGRPPPNPTALITSERMGALLRELEEQSDLVIIDTAAALAVSDALPLIQAASGAVMIVRMNRSSRVAVRRLQRVVVSAGAAVLGVVATGTTVTAAGYSDYYSSYGDRRGRGQLAVRSLQHRLRHGRTRINGHEATNGHATPVTEETSSDPDVKLGKR